MGRPQPTNLSSLWLDTLHQREEALRGNADVADTAHAVIMLVERGNLLRQERMNEERRPRRKKR